VDNLQQILEKSVLEIVHRVVLADDARCVHFGPEAQDSAFLFELLVHS